MQFLPSELFYSCITMIKVFSVQHYIEMSRVYRSLTWKCPRCGLISTLLGAGCSSSSVSAVESQLINSVVFKVREYLKNLPNCLNTKIWFKGKFNGWYAFKRKGVLYGSLHLFYHCYMIVFVCEKNWGSIRHFIVFVFVHNSLSTFHASAK